MQLEETEAGKNFAETCQKQSLRALDVQALGLRKAQGIGKMDSKPMMMGQKYQYHDAIVALDKVGSAIRKRMKKKGEA